MAEEILESKHRHGLKEILNLSYPVMLGMILQTLLGTCDLYFISKLGTGATAASSLGTSAAGVIFVMSALVASGVIPLVARSYGENNFDMIKKFTADGISLSLFFGIILGGLAYFNTEYILQVMYNPDLETLRIASDYTKVVFLTVPIVFLNSSLKSVLQGVGDTKTPLYIFGLANIINMILDPIFMFTLGYGVRGAAIATALSRIVSVVLIFVVINRKIYNKKLLQLLSSFKIDISRNIRILKIGGWACIQQISRPITGMLMFRIVFMTGGTAGTAAFGLGGQLFSYTFIFLSGLGMATSILIGQAMGRKDLREVDSVIKYSLKLSWANMIIFAIPYMIFPAFFFKVFIADPQVIDIGVNYLRIIYLGLVFLAIEIPYAGAFNGAGDTFPPMISSLVANVAFKLPCAYYLSLVKGMGTNGVWIAVSLSVVVEVAMLVFYFRKGKWKTKKI